jgi:hypothetical protein
LPALDNKRKKKKRKTKFVKQITVFFNANPMLTKQWQNNGKNSTKIFGRQGRHRSSFQADARQDFVRGRAAVEEFSDPFTRT